MQETLREMMYTASATVIDGVSLIAVGAYLYRWFHHAVRGLPTKSFFLNLLTCHVGRTFGF